MSYWNEVNLKGLRKEKECCGVCALCVLKGASCEPLRSLCASARTGVLEWEWEWEWEWGSFHFRVEGVPGLEVLYFLLSTHLLPPICDFSLLAFRPFPDFPIYGFRPVGLCLYYVLIRGRGRGRDRNGSGRARGMSCELNFESNRRDV